MIADIEDDFPNFAWWTLVYMLGLIIGVIITVATNSIATYHVAIVGFLAAGLVFTTSSVNSLIYYPEGSKEAGAAGFILLSMVAVSIELPLNSGPCAHHYLRSYGSFTTARNHKPHTAKPLTHSRSTKTTVQVGGRADI